MSTPPGAPLDDEYDAARHASQFELGTDGPRVIMVGVDGSVTSLRAAAYATGLARRQRCGLVVTFVASPSAVDLVMTSGLAAAAAEEALEQVAAEVRGQIEEFAREYQTKVTFLKRRGDPYTELRHAADEVQADMLVVGASTQAGHRLVGSVAGRLVRAGRWPVVVVP